MTKKILSQEQKEKANARAKDWNLKNPERVKEYRLQNAEKKKARTKDWNLKNPERVKANNKNYRLQNVEKTKAYNKNYWLQHPDYLQKLERAKAYAKDYRLQNPERDRAREKSYKAKRRKEDPCYVLIINLRSRIYQHCISIKSKKNFTTIEALGCTPQEFKGHLEALFQPNMTWENYGKKGWVVDHIKPISLAKTSDEIYLLNHYTNLQPMWELDNLIKSNKYFEPMLQLVA